LETLQGLPGFSRCTVLTYRAGEVPDPKSEIAAGYAARKLGGPLWESLSWEALDTQGTTFWNTAANGQPQNWAQLVRDQLEKQGKIDVGSFVKTAAEICERFKVPAGERDIAILYGCLWRYEELVYPP
jgi:hypothetical protein